VPEPKVEHSQRQVEDQAHPDDTFEIEWTLSGFDPCRVRIFEQRIQHERSAGDHPTVDLYNDDEFRVVVPTDAPHFSGHWVGRAFLGRIRKDLRSLKSKLDRGTGPCQIARFFKSNPALVALGEMMTHVETTFGFVSMIKEIGEFDVS
jgi:hypothetical protein